MYVLFEAEAEELTSIRYLSMHRGTAKVQAYMDFTTWTVDRAQGAI